ncbi:MAG TPA: hypothetical protein PLX95_01880 [bacterium]|nr:hypothetical protein [bacterium]
MVTQELIEYIKYQKSKKVADEDIVRELIENNWVRGDIENALNKVNSLDSSTPFETQEKDRDKVFVVDSTISHPATVVKENVEIPIGDKASVIIGIISMLFIVISFLFIYKAGMMVAVMSIIDHFSYTEGSMYYFIKQFPMYGWVVISFAISASVFLFNAFKIRVASKHSFTIGLVTLLLLPASLLLINYRLMHSVGSYFSTQEISLGENAPKTPSGTYTILVGVFSEPAFLISFITLSILIISYKKFHFKNTRISSKSKRYLILLSALFIIPTLFVVLKSYSVAKNDDFGYSRAVSKTRYHIYKPGVMPLGLVYTSNFITGKEMAGLKDGVQVVYDYTLEEVVDMKKSRPVIVKQVGVHRSFNINEYVAKESGMYSQTSTVNIPNTVGGSGYLILNPLGSSGDNLNLVFQKTDNVLISISTTDSGKQDLIDIAVSLE